MKMQDIPPADRPREKMLRYGPDRLTTVELLAILLRTGGQGLNALELARKISLKYPSPQLATTKVDELCQTFGLGESKACELVACFELGRRYLRGKRTELVLNGKDVWHALKDIRSHKKEHFVVFYLDSRSQEICREVISVGTINASLVHPREVFEIAVTNLASGVIVAHNHPSGDLEPSSEDVNVTRRLKEAGSVLGIPLIDHVIVTHRDYLSFKEYSLL